MGKLVKLVNTEKLKIINLLIREKAYQPDDRNYLFSLPLKNLEERLEQLKK
ncbi:hypothetical protein [Bacillus sp. V5-8f]|uniref:hypothetical protein n=1 Tax=Bacillus sp. V5-8f TaxID=2053044 RepID=UPI0015E14B34|nr:hypothetical protein [Bacillus sp. V5-8f]